MSLEPPVTDNYLPIIVIAVVVVFALRAFFRGILRLVFGMVSLGAGAFAGYQMFLNGREWLTPILGEPPDARTVLYAAWITGGLAYAVLAFTGKSLANLISGQGKTLGPASFAGAVFSLVPSAFLIWVVVMAVRTTGFVTFLDQTGREVVAEDGSEKPASSIWTQALEKLDASRFGGFFDRTDPIVSNTAGALSTLLLVMKDSDAWERLKNDPRVAAIVANPRIAGLVNSDLVRGDIANADYTSLIQRPQLRETAASQPVADALRNIDVRAVIDEALYEPVPRAIPVNQSPRAQPVRKRRRHGPKRGAY